MAFFARRENERLVRELRVRSCPKLCYPLWTEEALLQADGGEGPEADQKQRFKAVPLQVRQVPKLAHDLKAAINGRQPCLLLCFKLDA